MAKPKWDTKIEGKIFDELKDSSPTKLLTTDIIATNAKLSWATVQKYLLELHKQGKVSQIRVPRKVNLWMSK